MEKAAFKTEINGGKAAAQRQMGEGRGGGVRGECKAEGMGARARAVKSRNAAQFFRTFIECSSALFECKFGVWHENTTCIPCALATNLVHE